MATKKCHLSFPIACYKRQPLAPNAITNTEQLKYTYTAEMLFRNYVNKVIVST